jgi:L-cysteine:1D-myo-inositol 2-amino-2-deoxy-alpha-D-glucopyranoside ligase
MQSWAAVDVPHLPGRGPALQVFDTASQSLQEIEPGAGEPARMYVCGITPYDATHLGHAATYLSFDLLQRVWRDRGHRVHYVQNVTDVDDPLFERAAQTGDDWEQLGLREVELFRTDMAALRVLPPDDYVGAVEAIPRIVGLIERLCERGAAYELDGDVYFAADASPHFGQVSHLAPAAMVALSRERGGDPDRPGKKDPVDCLLWQARRPGEPAWESPLGPGRPGWHVECAAIALDRLGPTIDVQGGGNDLVFPHHELGAAEAHAATGEWPFARAFVHAGMVGLDGEKMSKSRGNLVFVHKLRAHTDPMAVRLALLAHHYRGDWHWSPDDLPAGERRLDTWRAGVRRPSGPDGAALLAEVRAALAADLDAPQALAAVDRWAAGDGADAGAPALVRDTVDALLGVAL